MATIPVRCPSCGVSGAVDAERTGSRLQCKRCGAVVVVPGTGTPGRSAGWQPGTVLLDRYEVRELLGEGGWGQVHRVHHRGWNIDLAVKSPRQELLAGGGAERFERECETWINLELHPNVVTCYYVRRVDGLPRVFAELVEAGSLKDWIENRRLYAGDPEEALARVLDVAIQFAWGLGHAHGSGLVHQDVKPANVLMTPEAAARVTDFGLARAFAAAGEIGPTGLPPGATGLATVGGMTPAYCSPEQAAGQRLGPATDLWSWAVSVLELFTGEVTWRSALAAPEALDAYLASGGGALSMPAEVALVLRSCLQREPGARPSGFAEVAAGLREVYERLTGGAFPRAEPEAVEAAADTLNNRALSLLDLGREAEALACWEAALERDPMHLQATYNRAYHQWRAAKLDSRQVLTALRSLETAHAEDAEYRRCLAWLYLEQGDEQALAELREAGRLPEDPGFRKAVEAPDRPRVRVRGELPGTPFVVSRSARSALVMVNGYQRWVWRLDQETVPLDGSDYQKRQTRGCFLPDERYCVTVDGPRLCVWHIETREVRRELTDDSNGRAGPWAVAAPTDRHLVTLAPVSLRVWDLESGEVAWELPLPQPCAPSLGPDGRWALIAQRSPQLLEVGTGREIWRRPHVPKPGESPQGSSYQIPTVAASPDGRYLVLYDQVAPTVVIDTRTGQEVLRLDRGYLAPPYAFSGDSRRLAGWAPPPRVDGVEARTDRVEVWELSPPRKVGSIAADLPPYSRQIHCSLLEDGRHALVESSIREVATGREVATCRVPGPGVIVHGPFLFGRGGNEAVTEIRFPVCSWSSAHPYPALCRPREAARVGAAQQQARRLLAEARTHLEDGRFAEAHRLLERARREEGFDRSRELLAALAECGRGAGAPRRRLRHAWLRHRLEAGPLSAVSCFRFTPDGRQVLTGSHDGLLRRWEVESGAQLGELTLRKHRWSDQRGYSAKEWPLEVYPGGTHALVMDEARHLMVWNLRSDRQTDRTLGDNGYMASLQVSPDGRWVAVGLQRGVVELFETDSRRDPPVRLGTPAWSIRNANRVLFSPDGRRLLAPWCSYEKSGLAETLGDLAETFRGGPEKEKAPHPGAAIWDLASRRKSLELGPLERWEHVESAAFSPDESRVGTLSRDGTVRLWDAATGAELHQFAVSRGHQRPGESTEWSRRLRFTRDGRSLVAIGPSGTVHAWDVEGGAPAATLENRSRTQTRIGIAWLSSDGRFLIPRGQEPAVPILDLRTGEPAARLEGHQGPVTKVEVSPDGRYVLTAVYSRGSQPGRPIEERQVWLWELDWEWDYPAEIASTT
jgi:WD40 repeat protein/tetratricopeptide (TPR) repeat protein